MGLRMRKSIQICKGVRLNLGSKGASISFGTKGLRHTINTNGRRTSSVGIPGTGISYVKNHNSGSKKKSTRQQSYSNTSLNNTVAINKSKVEEYNFLQQSLRGIHKDCDEYINWQEIRLSNEPFPLGGIGPKQAEAIKALSNYKPGFFEKLKGSDKRQELERAVELATKEDTEDHLNWERLHLLAQRILDGDIDAYFEVIYQMNPLDDLMDFGSNFEFGTDDPNTMVVEFTINQEAIVPSYSLTLTKTGQLSQKELTKTAYYDLVQDFVCSCTIRIARDVFALLPVKNVVVHAVENRLNTQTGKQEDMTVLSVLFERDVLNGLNFDMIDPSDAMNNFLHYMKFQKTTGFKPVERVEV